MREPGNHRGTAAHLYSVDTPGKTAVTDVRIALAEPRPGRLPDGGFAVGQILVVLADDPGRRAMPVWLTVPDGDSLLHLIGGPEQSGPAGAARAPAKTAIPEDTATRLLSAAGATVTGVQIELSGAAASGDTDPGAVALIELAGPGGIRRITAPPGYGLALAAASGAPVRVASETLGRLGQLVQGDDLAGQFLPPAAARPSAFRGGRRWRFEPRNMSFADGLDRWDLDGSFLRQGASHRGDYACAAQQGSAVLWSAAPQPGGSAELGQTIFADDYRGATVTVRGELRAEETAGLAGLFLRFHAGGPLQPPDRDPQYPSPPVTGSADWAWRETSAVVPGDADVITFGVSLAGSGRVMLRAAELIRSA
jgi:hypothetical protein